MSIKYVIGLGELAQCIMRLHGENILLGLRLVTSGAPLTLDHVALGAYFAHELYNLSSEHALLATEHINHPCIVNAWYGRV